MERTYLHTHLRKSGLILFNTDGGKNGYHFHNHMLFVSKKTVVSKWISFTKNLVYFSS